MRHALLRIGAVGLASAVAAVVLLGVGRLILVGDLAIAMPSFSQVGPSPTSSPSPTARGAVLSDIATPNPSPTTSPTAESSPTAIPLPIALTAFRFSGRAFVGLVVPDVGRTFVAPFAGRVEVQNYQLIEGEVRVGSGVPGLPFYPYISVVTGDQKITYRPGTLGSVTEVLARDGAQVAAGEPLFRLVGPGRSSWATFYNASAPYQVVVSLQSVPGGRDLDPAPYLGGG